MTVNDFFGFIGSVIIWFLELVFEFLAIFLLAKDWGESSLFLVVLVILTYFILIMRISYFIQDVFQFIKSYLLDKNFRDSYHKQRKIIKEQKREERKKEQEKQDREKMSFLGRLFLIFYFGIFLLWILAIIIDAHIYDFMSD